MNAKPMVTTTLCAVLWTPIAAWAQAAAPAPAAPETPAAKAAINTPAAASSTAATKKPAAAVPVAAKPATSPAAPAENPVAVAATDQPAAPATTSAAIPADRAPGAASQPASPAAAGAEQFTIPRVKGSVEPIAPPSPPKTSYPLGIELSVMPVWQTSHGYDLFSNNDIATRVGLSVDLEVADLADRTPLSIELGWNAESHGDKLWNDNLETNVSAHNLHGGIKVQHRVLSFLAPHVRITGGTSALTATYSVPNSSGAREYETQHWVAFGTLGIGVTGAIPTRSVVQPGVTLEGGYLISGSLPLALEPKLGDGALSTTGAKLGTLERSGPYLRIGASIRY